MMKGAKVLSTPMAQPISKYTYQIGVNKIGNEDASFFDLLFNLVWNISAKERQGQPSNNVVDVAGRLNRGLNYRCF